MFTWQVPQKSGGSNGRRSHMIHKPSHAPCRHGHMVDVGPGPGARTYCTRDAPPHTLMYCVPVTCRRCTTFTCNTPNRHHLLRFSFSPNRMQSNRNQSGGEKKSNPNPFHRMTFRCLNPREGFLQARSLTDFFFFKRAPTEMLGCSTQSPKYSKNNVVYS